MSLTDANDICAETCPICLSSLDRDGKKLPCGHHLHVLCLRQLLLRARCNSSGNSGDLQANRSQESRQSSWIPTCFQCPMCRKRINMKTGLLVTIENDSHNSSLSSSLGNTIVSSARESVTADARIPPLGSNENIFSRILSFPGISPPDVPNTLESLNILQDIFPNHPRHVIERVFRGSRNLEATVDTLLVEQPSIRISNGEHSGSGNNGDSTFAEDSLQHEDAGLRRRRSL
jgi:hypothetical protein